MTITFAALLVVTWTAGVLIGVAGVGGVLRAPALIVLGGMEPHEATAMALSCVVPIGLASAVQHRKAARRAGSIERKLALGLVLGAVAGALLNGLLPTAPITIALAGIAGASGLRMLLAQGAVHSAAQASLRARAGVLIGSTAGCASGLTGTSGPAVLIPALMLARVPVKSAVAIGQASQAVVAPAGAVAYLSTVDLDFRMLASLSAAITWGYLLGQAVSPRLLGRSLQTLVAAILLGTAALLLIRQTMTGH